MTLGQDDLAVLADLAKIPVHRQDVFAARMTATIKSCWDVGAGYVANDGREELRLELAKIEAGLRATLDVLQANSRGTAFLDSELRAGLTGSLELVGQLHQECFVALRGFGVKQGGRPSTRIGDAGVSGFDLLVFVVAGIVKDEGGTLTLYERQQRGTMIDFLESMRKLLPANFIPNAMSINRLRDIREQATGKTLAQNR